MLKKITRVYIYIYIYIYIYSFIHSFISIQPQRPGWQEPEPSHVTGMALAHCIVGKFLGVVLSLPSPAFRRSHFRRQVPVRPQIRERSQQPKVELWARNCPIILPKFQLPRKFSDLLHAANLRHGTEGFTSPPKEGVLRIFSHMCVCVCVYIYIYKRVAVTLNT